MLRLLYFRPKIAKTGIIDWVGLTKTSANFSIGSLARLSRTGIDPYTLQVGQAICFQFYLDESSQERISDATASLKCYCSLGIMMWFGFGIKFVVTKLAQIEQGKTLIGLYAAITSSYHSFYAAEVLREICVLSNPPETLLPALKEWRVLAGYCAGILTTPPFTKCLNTLRRGVKRYSTTSSSSLNGIRPFSKSYPDFGTAYKEGIG